MPLSRAMEEMARRDMERREAARLQQMEREMMTTMRYTSTWSANIVPDPFFEKRSSDQRERRNKEEIDRVKSFIQTGLGRMIYADKSDTIFMIGEDIKPTHLLFTMDKTTIRAQKDRSKHLKPVLQELAEREGLKLKFTVKVPELDSGARDVRYYAFKGINVDDSELIAQARARDLRGPEPEPELEECGYCGACSDPDCETCMRCEECSLNDWETDDEDEDW
jgi:hypothetical protein